MSEGTKKRFRPHDSQPERPPIKRPADSQPVRPPIKRPADSQPVRPPIKTQSRTSGGLSGSASKLVNKIYKTY